MRLRKQPVRQETAEKFFREDTHMNVLDVIAGAFHPEQVIADLRAMPADGYEKDIVDLGKGGVHATYRKAVLKYFQRDASEALRGKRAWISERLSIEIAC